MTIGVVPEGWWGPACRMADVACVGLPLAADGARGVYGGDVRARIEAGSAVASTLAGKQIDMILDVGGAGLTFIEGEGGIEALALTHDHLGVPLVSHLTDPLAALARDLSWSVVCQSLRSKTWIKAVGDAGLANDLRDFDVPGVIDLPPAAMEYAYATAPLDPDGLAADVAFVGDSSSVLFPGQARADLEHWPAAVTDAIALGCKGPRFYNLYDHLDPLDDEHSVEPMVAYFNAKLKYAAALCRHHRDRMIERLHASFGTRFRLIGKGWAHLGDNAASPPPANLPQYIDSFRTAAVNVCVWDGTSETTIDGQHFEIAAAGGFLLCYHHPAVSQHFEIGQECETFADCDELIHKIRYYLAHPAKRVEIARAGQQRALSEHLLRHRVTAAMRLAGVVIEVSRSQDSLPCGRTSEEPPPCERKTEEPLPYGRGSVGAADSPLSVTITPSVSDHAAIPISLPGGSGKVLMLVNPGRFTHHYMLDMTAALSRAGVGTVVCELSNLWQSKAEGRPVRWDECVDLVERENIRLAISAGTNGFADFPMRKTPDGEVTSFLAEMKIPHILWWTDHPQWNCDKVGLRPDLQPIMRHEHMHHFVKSEMAARELRDLLGWPNCYGLPVAEDPGQLKPVRDVEPDFDVVAVVGSAVKLADGLERFLDDDDPDVDAISRIVADGVHNKLSTMWQDRADAAVQNCLQSFGEAWVEARRANPLIGSYWLFSKMDSDHSEACAFLRANPLVYFDAIECLWDLGNWQRTFTLMHLARRFKVGVFGSDWSSVGLGGGSWVEHEDQPAAYARGRIAINISQAGEEEGLSHKPFQIAASGVTMVHINRKGVADCFTPDDEIALFDTPGQARAIVAELLDDPDRRAAIATAARNRLCRDHTWSHRLREMFRLVGAPFPQLTGDATTKSATFASVMPAGRPTPAPAAHP